jgi:ribosomal protein L7/L12
VDFCLPLASRFEVGATCPRCLVDGAPKTLLEKVAKEAADDAKAKLESARATVTVK